MKGIFSDLVWKLRASSWESCYLCAGSPFTDRLVRRAEIVRRRCLPTGEGVVLLEDEGLAVGVVLVDWHGVGLGHLDRVRGWDVLDHGDRDWVGHWAVDWDWDVLGDLHGVGLRYWHHYWTIYWNGDLGTSEFFGV